MSSRRLFSACLVRFSRCAWGGLALVLLGTGVSCSTSADELLIQISQGDQGSKGEAIVKLGELLAEKESAGFPFDEGDLEALELLRDVARKDPDSVQRMRAISALRGLKKLDHTDVYLTGLESRFWGVRWESAKSLLAQPSDRASAKLVERVQKESNKVVLLDVVKALAKLDTREAQGGLLAVFLDRTGRYDEHRMKVYRAIRRQSGKSWAMNDTTSWLEYQQAEFGVKRASALEELEPLPRVGGDSGKGGGA